MIKPLRYAVLISLIAPLNIRAVTLTYEVPANITIEELQAWTPETASTVLDYAHSKTCGENKYDYDAAVWSREAPPADMHITQCAGLIMRSFN